MEGLAADGKLHPMQEAFADLGAAQCGYCTPGILVTAKALLADNPHPNRAQIREAISGNLCRCTGYLQIFEAVEAAIVKIADEGNGLGAEAAGAQYAGRKESEGSCRRNVDASGDQDHVPATPKSSGSSARPPRRRVDARAKVTGQTIYADDISLPRMAYCKLLRSPHPHAKIRKIDYARALAHPGVYLVLTGKGPAHRVRNHACEPG